jgi:hypothetical protein
MFGKSKPVLFEPYGRRRSRGLPRWLVLLLVGIVAGAVGLFILQERYLPPRLSADASTSLRAAYEQADADRQRLKREVADATQRLEVALADKKGLADELAASHTNGERLREDVASLVAALPPDPRGGTVEVRAGRFTVSGGALDYDVVLSRDRAGNKPLPGVLQLVVVGDGARGGDTTVSLKPVAIAVGAHETVRGSLSLPDGFKPRQATVNVLDRVGGKQLGMRVMHVK